MYVEGNNVFEDSRKKLQKSIFQNKKNLSTHLSGWRCQAGDQYVRQKTSEYKYQYGDGGIGAVNTKLISSHISISIKIQSSAA